MTIKRGARRSAAAGRGQALTQARRRTAGPSRRARAVARPGRAGGRAPSHDRAEPAGARTVLCDVVCPLTGLPGWRTGRAAGGNGRARWLPCRRRLAGSVCARTVRWLGLALLARRFPGLSRIWR